MPTTPDTSHSPSCGRARHGRYQPHSAGWKQVAAIKISGEVWEKWHLEGNSTQPKSTVWSVDQALVRTEPAYKPKRGLLRFLRSLNPLT